VAQTAKDYHRNGWGTPGSATLTIDAIRSSEWGDH
jgi:pectinesterase